MVAEYGRKNKPVLKSKNVKEVPHLAEHYLHEYDLKKRLFNQVSVWWWMCATIHFLMFEYVHSN